LGLDVNASRVIREYVMNWVRGQKGKTVLLTNPLHDGGRRHVRPPRDHQQRPNPGRGHPGNLKRRLKKDTTFRLEVDPLKDTSPLKGIAGVKNFSETSDGGGSVLKLTFILEEESAVSDIMSESCAKAARFTTSTSRNPRSRMCSSAWSGGPSSE